MGLIVCDKHGPSGINTCCGHVFNAVKSGTELPDVHRVDCMLDNTCIAVDLLCADCAKAAGLAERSVAFKEALDDAVDDLGEIDRWLNRVSDHQPVCQRCASELLTIPPRGNA